MKPKGDNVYPPVIEDFIRDERNDYAEVMAVLGMKYLIVDANLIKFYHIIDPFAIISPDNAFFPRFLTAAEG